MHLAHATRLATHLGPEVMHNLMHEVLTVAQRTMQRYEGTITQYLGDGFLALFGAPVAHEDHARRAVLAALELRSGCARAIRARTLPGHHPRRPYRAPHRARRGGIPGQ